MYRIININKAVSFANLLLIMAGMLYWSGLNAQTATGQAATEAVTDDQVVDVEKLASSVRERAEKLNTDLQALVKSLPEDLKDIQQTEQKFEDMLKMAEQVLKYLGPQGDLVASLQRYNKYAEERSEKTRDDSNPEVVKLSKDWDIRAKKVVDLIEYVRNLEVDGQKGLNALKANKTLAVELIRLKKFDTATEKARLSIQQVGKMVEDIKSLSQKTQEIEKPATPE